MPKNIEYKNIKFSTIKKNTLVLKYYNFCLVMFIYWHFESLFCILKYVHLRNIDLINMK